MFSSWEAEAIGEPFPDGAPERSPVGGGEDLCPPTHRTACQRAVGASENHLGHSHDNAWSGDSVQNSRGSKKGWQPLPNHL